MTRAAPLPGAPRPMRRHRGGVLVIAMILLVVIGLTAAASMRRALSNERVVNNLRLEGLAQQLAELALRYCEVQMQLPKAHRATSYLEGLDDLVVVGGGTPAAGQAWRESTTWPAPLAPGVAPPSSTTAAPKAVHVPDDWVWRLDATARAFKLNGRPQCLVEKLTAPGGGDFYRVTARGFSPDYAEHASSRALVQGSVVWLQSDLVFD